MRDVLLPFVLLSMVACAGAPEGATTATPSPSTALPDATPAASPTADGQAPRPYTAAQIRETHPDGTLLRIAIRQQGQEFVQFMRFENGDDEAVDVVTWVERPDGEPMGPKTTQHATWTELRDHAAFDAAKTERVRSRCEVGAGTFACWKYTVAGADSAAPVSHFHFADERPGPPVLFVMERDGQELVRAELVEYRRGS